MTSKMHTNVNIKESELKAIKRAIDLLVFTSEGEDRFEADRIADHYDAFIARNKLTPKTRG